MLLYIVEFVLLIVALVIIARLIFFLQKQHQQKRLVKKEPILGVDLGEVEVETNVDLLQSEDGNDLLLEEEYTIREVPFTKIKDENEVELEMDKKIIEKSDESLGVKSSQAFQRGDVKKYATVEKDVKSFASTNVSANAAEKKPEQKTSPQEIISLTILAKKGEAYSGYELLQSLLALGFRYGDMNIFHRHENIDGTGEVLFSLAQAVQPGTFDLNDMGALSCVGLIMFMEVGAQANPLDALNLMVDTAKLLIEDLGGEIRDDEQKPLTAGSIARMRSRVLIRMRRK